MIDKLVGSCSTQTASDEELVVLFLKSNDNRHFEKLYDRYAYKVYKTCVSVTKDASLAEDLMHDIFLKLITKLNTFKIEAKFSTWLFKVSYNHCMDFIRSGKKNIITVHGEEIEMQDDFDINKIFEIEEVDTIGLRTALSQLNLEEKALLYLKYLEGRSTREISTIFSLTESAVKMRLMRAREKLRKRYLEAFLNA
ncbi:RNA polymerase sigma factor [Dyadobacter sp. CY323]|uniref:RNA polymerase sigma factor n=1 Tax=Dyadobacter sp. CY323 TaxID=2907302 RepID=UPI001F15B41C|nr:sigma-70 family RNA polymerase sigma factor [Dyadobacter sp. CY323]MCE6988802.1 sigma-70 family RNA polymerase sigma factor [Dyadobacter sp. CY323]